MAVIMACGATGAWLNLRARGVAAAAASRLEDAAAAD
jgi:hypothetical protein